MSSLNLLRRFPPGLTSWLFFYGVPFILLLRFLVGTVSGIFISSILLYIGMSTYGETKPFSLAQLILWIDALPTESKTAVITSVLTVVGFLIAFHAATVNWKAEALANLKSHVANEIEEFFAEASRLTSDADIYIGSIIVAVNKAQQQGATPEATFAVQWALDRLPKFYATRERLSVMSVEVHRISGRHFTVLSTIPGAIKSLEDCASAFSEITRDMWVRLPSIPTNYPNPIELFVAQVDVTECSKFISICKKNSGFINGLSGGVRGALLSPIVGLRLSMLTSLTGKKALFEEAMSKVREGPK